jgi:hypothetical protein
MVASAVFRFGHTPITDFAYCRPSPKPSAKVANFSNIRLSAKGGVRKGGSRNSHRARSEAAARLAAKSPLNSPIRFRSGLFLRWI